MLVMTVLFVWIGSSGFSCGEKHKTTGKKVLILGIDGMDPRLLDGFMAKGLMPNFQKLMSSGDYKPLISSIPPQSPVAWSNFITGSNPGKHGIYDFIHRNPESYFPYLSTSKAEDPDPDDSIAIGRRVIWWAGGSAELLRRGKPFWEYLAEDGIYTRVFKIPSNFPPYEGKGWSGSGMGTPDMLGTYGTFTFFTDNPADHPESIGGGTVTPVYPVGNIIRTRFEGPKNIFELDERRPYRDANKEIRNYAQSEVPITIYIDPEQPQIKIEFQDQEVMLSQGEWSEWVPIKFEMWKPFVSADGIVRFYLKEVPNMKEGTGDFKLYASPINMDPKNPSIPVTNPPEYAQQIAEDIGYFYTQGMPEDTKARQADLDILNDGELFHQMMLVHEEDLEIFRWHLDRWKDGLLYYYFSSLDLGTHMFWRLHDPGHPAHDPEWAKKLGDPLETLYKDMDKVLGWTLERMDKDAFLIVMSDHGFAPWEKSFQVNTWLLENGYIKLKPDVDQEEVEYFRDKATFDYAVDWSRTTAYGFGINGVYINLMGRERYGAVSPVEKKELVDEIVLKLSEYVDQETGEKPILDAEKSREVFKGDELEVAPDIILGFKRPFRGGDESALGKFPLDIITINESSWSGDHCIATREVPGVILTNRKISKKDPALIDVGPTILSIFGIQVPEQMDGEPIF
jgi:predicted AlkP superfamily phosphohydrolase/phosphomutase